MSFPTDRIQTSCNIDGMEDNSGKLIPEKELAELFIQTRGDDLIDSFDSLEFDIDINENPLINKILYQNKDEFRNVLRKGVIMGILTVTYDRNDMTNIALQKKILTNKVKINFNVPSSIEINQLTSNDYEGEVVTFEAKISRWSKTRTITHYALYKCPDCGDIMTHEFKPKFTSRCSECRSIYEFFKPDKSEDTKRIILKEMMDDFSEGRLPFTISADIYGKSVWEVELSDKVRVTGIFRSIPLKMQDGKISQEFIPTIQIISIKNLKDDKSEQPDMELMKKLKDLEQKEKLIDAVIDGFAYNIYKKRMEKKAIICSLIGSKWIGQVGKGNPPMIHILFVGDPDTYKSTIMKYIINVSDNCILADSTTVSNAGLKAVAIKMDDGRWSISAGLLPEYNGGVIFLDEFGDLKPDIYADLKAPMIDGWVSKHVAGEDFNGRAETGILASMNPIEGVYDDNKTIYENLERLPKPLITRFDAIFKFSKLSVDYDSAMIRAHFKKSDIHGKPDGYLTDNEIKLFLNYVRNIHVEITDDAFDRSAQFFAEVEEKGGEKSGTETRTENAVMKFAVAIAKWHMSTIVSAQHVNEAIKLFSASLDTLDLKLEDGQSINERMLKKRKDGKIESIRNSFKAIEDDDGYVFEDKVLDEIMKRKTFGTRGQASTELNRLREAGTISKKNRQLKGHWLG